MAKTRVITDSVASLPSVLVEQLDIHVIPVRVTVEGVEYRDVSEDISVSDVRRLQEATRVDTTPWSPEHYCEHYLQASEGVDSLVHVVAFSSFTSTMSLARAGASMAADSASDLRVVVVDSRSTLMAQGFVALSAARTASDGGELDEVVSAAVATSDAVRTFCSFTSLRYVARTGRVPRLAAWANSLLSVKPVVGLSRGKEEPLALVRSRSQELRTLAQKVHSVARDGAQPLHIAVMDTARWEDGEELLERLCSELHPVESFHGELSPLSQVVSGPGFLGVALYSEPAP